MNSSAPLDRATLPHPILILIRGLPGSGKSHLASALQKALGSTPVVALDPDTIDFESRAYADHVKTATTEGVDPKLHAYRFLRGQAYDGIATHKIIIWNQPFSNLEIFQKMIDKLEIHAAEHQTRLPILVVEVSVNPETANARVNERKQAGGHGPSLEAFTRFVSEYKSFANEGYDVVSVDGQGDVSTSVRKILDRIEQLLAT